MRTARTQNGKVVYLAGPITGLDYQRATEWRKFATGYLNPHGWSTLDPMRGKESLKDERYIFPTYEGTDKDLSNRDIFNRDMSDVGQASVLLVNLTDYNGGFGTAFEVGSAWTVGIPVVFVCPPSNSRWASHPFVTQSADRIFGSLIEALEYIVAS